MSSGSIFRVTDVISLLDMAVSLGMVGEGRIPDKMSLVESGSNTPADGLLLSMVTYSVIVYNHAYVCSGE